VSALEFRVAHPDGRSERLVVDSDRVLVGSGAHCEIRLAAAEAAVEHVLITFLGGGVFATTRALNPAPTINGFPFTQAPLLAESTLGVGRVQITVGVVEVVDDANVVRRKKQATSPMTIVLALIAVPLALYVLIDEPPADTTAASKPREVPALWASDPSACPQRGEEARNLARDKRALAEAKRERGPFHVQDGVAAVPVFRLSAACFRAAHDEAAAVDMDAAADRLKSLLTEDYRAHQMRLEHALLVKDLRTAQKEVRVLLAMLDGQAAPYVVWLSNLNRRITVKLGKATG